MVVPVKRALISVTDKKKVAKFASELARKGVKIISTGGTGGELARAGVPYKEVSEETGFPEILGGRVKTLHPRIYGGILYRRGLASDEEERKAHGINTLDLLVVNLYDFAGRAEGKSATDPSAIEAIDIGGPALIRAAAKNWFHVGVVVSPDRYEEIIEELEREGGLTEATRRSLAAEAFALTARYDRMIADWFSGNGETVSLPGESEPLPEHVQLNLKRHQALRYGENPHQGAALYRLSGEEGLGIPASRQIHGKELSFNNLIDADIALALPAEFDKPCVAILKHTTPSGVAVGESLAEAEAGARACDPLSAFGGIVGMNRPCDRRTASQISKAFTEVVVAPSFEPGALEILKKKKNLRLLEVPEGAVSWSGFDMRRITGGLLLQQRDGGFPELDELRVVTDRGPTEAELADLRFAWRVVKYVKSNAVLFARSGKTLGIGAGQMSRVDAVRLARLKAEDARLDLRGSVLASDAFFPFADGLLQAADAGVTAVIQPGGSVRDQEVTDAANERGIAMVFTGRRHFRHA